MVPVNQFAATTIWLMWRLRFVVLLALVAGACASAGEAAPSVDSSIAPTSQPEVVEVAEAPASTTAAPTTTTTTTTQPDRIGRSIAAQISTDACVTEPPVEVGLQTGELSSGGVQYRYQWTVPSRYTGEPTPVVLNFHGLDSNGPEQGLFSGFPKLGEAEGFISVEPTGVSLADDDRNSWELPQFDTDERNDVAFVLDLLDELAGKVCIDQQRIYSIGMSNGGFFTSVLVCELSERIAAAVSVAATTFDESCAPKRAVPYLAFHGTDDQVVPYSGGGESSLAPGATSDFFQQVMPDEFAQFAASFGCTDPIDSQITAEVSLRTWSGCRDDVEVGFYTLEQAGHTWPGSPISAMIPALGVTNLDVDATAIAWEFFARNSLAG